MTLNDLIRDAAEARADEAFGDLPEWDLSDLYESPDCAALKADFARVADLAAKLQTDYQGKMLTLSGDGLAQAVADYETISRISGRIGSYAGLRYYANTADQARAKFMGDAQATLNDASAHMVFFTLELNRIPDEAMAARIAESPALARYAPWLERVRSFRPHQLSDELEQYQHDMSVVGASAWNRLFDETLSSLTFDVDGEALSLERTLNLMQDPDRETRRKGGEAVAKTLGANIRLFTLVTNTLAKEKEIDDRWRKLPTPQAYRHLSNHVEPEVVQALRDAVVAAYPRLSHRYYALKAKWMGLEALEYWDRNAPLPTSDESVIAWDDAKRIVLTAYAGFAPEMADIARKFFDNPWIDAPVRPGKATGAFAHPTVSDAHPYVMLNYLGKKRDVMTLAHELGHGVHQVLAAGQGELLSHTPLTLAETASVFGEMLTFQSLLAAETDKGRKKALLASKVEDMINTVVRQIAFYEFECRVHEARRGGELTSDDLGRIWMEVSRESLGEAVNLAPGYETFWSYIPHFIHSPFYVYAYAFGDGLVNALYGVYAQGVDGFEAKYFDMLRAGGSKPHKALLAPFGLDATDPAFWNKGLEVISDMIGQLEAMED